ncbi:MAG TPA: hypothetical protein VL025_17925 [Thermoanaerobaculia bacterium]|nr:hypothetical protein [Thermoanaerobaculia bacterium]
MKYLVLVTVAVLCLAGCSGPGGLSGKLSAEECGQLMDKISEITYASLSDAERAEVAETPAEREQSVQECVDEQNWDRDGFECAMKASSEAELKLCILNL